MLAAHAAGLTDIIVPERNRRDLDDVPADVRGVLRFHPVESVGQVLAPALEASVVKTTAADGSAAVDAETLEPDPRVEAEVLHLLDREGPRSDARGFSTPAADDGPRDAHGVVSRRQVRDVEVEAVRGERALDELEAVIDAGRETGQETGADA